MLAPALLAAAEARALYPYRWRIERMPFALKELLNLLLVMDYRPNYQLQDVHSQFLRWLYQHGRCLAFPSLYEGFGLPVLDAMASGCPVITSRVASLPDVEGDGAVYVEPLQVASLRDALVHLIRDPERRRAVRAAGLGQAKRFSYEATAEATLGVYETAGRRP